MTIYEIGIITHYYCRVDDHEDMQRNPPVWLPTIAQFIDDGLIQAASPQSDRCYQITERGRAYCDALQAVPLPEQAWITRWPVGSPKDGR